MEIGYRLLQARIRNVDHPIETGPIDIAWSPGDMNAEICDRGMRGFKPYFPLGCKRIISENAKTMWEPWHGEHNNMRLLADHEFVHYKQVFCSRINACPMDRIPTVEDVPRKRTKCEACAELAADLRTVLRRWMYPPWSVQSVDASYGGKVDLDIALETHWCSTIALRHYRPAALESRCRDALEEKEAKLRTLLDVSNETGVGRLRKYMARRPIGNEKNWERDFCSKDLGIGLCDAKGLEQLRKRWERAFEANVDFMTSRFELMEKYERRNKVKKELDELANASQVEPKSQRQAELEVELIQLQDEIARLETELPKLMQAASATQQDYRRWTLPNSQYYSPRVEEQIEKRLTEDRREREAKLRQEAEAAAEYQRRRAQLQQMQKEKEGKTGESTSNRSEL